jgi:hypothetical protein
VTLRRRRASGRAARPPREGTRRDEPVACPYCGQVVTFCWSCRHCGFHICQRCMTDNLEMFTCNNVTWWCADCGESNGY